MEVILERIDGSLGFNIMGGTEVFLKDFLFVFDTNIFRFLQPRTFSQRNKLFVLSIVSQTMERSPFKTENAKIEMFEVNILGL